MGGTVRGGAEWETAVAGDGKRRRTVSCSKCQRSSELRTVSPTQPTVRQVTAQHSLDSHATARRCRECLVVPT
ncbi:hypothetical protein E2C01_007583 [Portunus trituberculatus]|uniref:Uncharacterized protein n=1 Tax=Portunus trituberculatus TaxID=210409 RepID=A0A5B7CYH2_PORTR|nr:hypothetical protein [Portunus trituberculatus]